jgi:hypothetical protein
MSWQFDPNSGDMQWVNDGVGDPSQAGLDAARSGSQAINGKGAVQAAPTLGKTSHGSAGAGTAHNIRTDALGNSVPDQRFDPSGYRAWAEGNLNAQRSGALGIQSQVGALTGDIQLDILRRQQEATAKAGGLQPDTSGQFNPGTRTTATAADRGQALVGLSNAPQADFKSPVLGAVQGGAPAQTTGVWNGADTGGQVVANPSKVEQAAGQAKAAVGAAPQIDMGVADRQLGAYQEALGMSREVIDRLLNGASTAQRLGSQTLRTQLALARSARGGPGAVQQAMSQAQQQAPELQAQATQSAVGEELSRLNAAGNVAGNFAQAALGARGQDVQIAQSNQNAGLQVKDMITRLTGTQLELDQRNQELIGQLARDLAATEFQWASLSAEQASKALEYYLQVYGIDKNYAAQLKALEQSGKITSKDILNGIIGIAGAAGSVVGGALAGG